MNNKLNFQSFEYNVNNTIYFYDITGAINSFSLFKLSLRQKEQKANTNNIRLAITFKIKLESGFIQDISTLQIVDIIQVKSLESIFYDFWICKSRLYINDKILKIIFTYKFIDNVIYSSPLSVPSSLDNNNSLLPFNYESLPKNRLLETWGEELLILGDKQYIVHKDDYLSYFIIKLSNEYFITVLFKEKVLFRFHDIYDMDENNHNTFLRIINNSKLYYLNGCFYILN